VVLATKTRVNAAKPARQKLSITVLADTCKFLEQKVASGQAATLAEAVDQAVRKVRRLENRKRLAIATSRYFEQLEPRAVAEETALARDLSSAAGDIDG